MLLLLVMLLLIFTFRLDLHSNEFQEVPMALGKLSKLQKINLGGNKISYVPQGFFDNFENLKSVVLKRNKLTSFPARMPRQMVKIAIDQNGLTDLPDLRYLDQLHTLKAEANKIDFIRFDAFPPKLNELSLCFNDLSRTNAQFNLKTLRELRRLTLTNSNPWLPGREHNLGKFYNGVSNKLRVLSVRGMQIESFSDGFFDDFQRLEVLDISNNSLTTFDSDWFRCNSKLFAISLANNSWHCDCNFAMHLKAIKKAVEEKFTQKNKRPQDEDSKRYALVNL